MEMYGGGEAVRELVRWGEIKRKHKWGLVKRQASRVCSSSQ